MELKVFFFIYLFHTNRNTMIEKNRINRTEVVTFYLIACAVSWPFFYWRDLMPEAWAASQVPSALRNLGFMWGPGIAAIVCFILFRKTHVRTITWTGTSLLKSLAFFFLPYMVWLGLTLLQPDQNKLSPGFFLEIIPFGFLMILGEELGWRGYLQDALRPLKEWKRWVVLGLLWEFWHFTRGMTHGELPQILLRKSIFIVSVILLTIIIGKLTERTKSLLVAITLHSWVNIQFEFPGFNTQLAGAISVVIWTLLIWKWRTEKPATQAAFS